jgi:hypothetical protein
MGTNRKNAGYQKLLEKRGKCITIPDGCPLPRFPGLPEMWIALAGHALGKSNSKSMINEAFFPVGRMVR